MEIRSPHPGVFQAKSIFLAGGITNCRNWQSEAIDLLGEKYPEVVVIYNPRRTEFDVEDRAMEKEQIEWEFEALRKADVILFWFEPIEIQPITLYELGAWSMTTKPIVVGADEKYPRLRDVMRQTNLVRPNHSHVAASLKGTVDQAVEALEHVQTTNYQLRAGT